MMAEAALGFTCRIDRAQWRYGHEEVSSMKGRMSREGAPRHRALWAVISGVVGAVVLAIGSAAPAQAASVEPIPVASGPWGCSTMAAYFGEDPGTWKEIRFTHDKGQSSIRPGLMTKTAQGNTITVTLTAEGTVDFTSKLPIEAVYVNKGTGADGAHAFYRYVPPVLSDTGLGLKPVVLSGVDHIVLCWTAPSTTTTTTTTTTTSAAPPTTAPTTVAVLPTSIARPVTTLVELPETGGATASTLLAATILLLAGGLAAAGISRWSPRRR